MFIYKCKLCDGELEIDRVTRTAKCKYCGTEQTLPKTEENDKKDNLLMLAERARKANEYDKAIGLYESALIEDNADSEIYWSLALCEYGVEYIEDPNETKRVITCNRTQYKSFLADENYLSAIKYATPKQKAIYRNEAKKINEIQKNILSVSEKETPFDVFLCYKETDEKGRRTKDSVLAQEIFYRLSKENIKVFFAKITLEDKLGENYEPYIFAALNSAKVMVAVATNPSYLQAVWVKNEWSRFLSLMKKHPQKTLIPAYMNFSPYELPEEMALLQAQDMSQIGFMQDLTRGIQKIIDGSKPNENKETIREKTIVVENNAVPVIPAANNTLPLIKRAYIFLENKVFDKADEYCEKVLDLDPENANAYLGKTLALLQISSVGELANGTADFQNNVNFKNACRFADKKLKSELDEIISIYNKNVRLRAAEKKYIEALNKMNGAHNSNDFFAAADMFNAIAPYKESTECISLCKEKGAELKKQEILQQAEQKRQREEKIKPKQIRAFTFALKQLENSLHNEQIKEHELKEIMTDYRRRVKKTIVPKIKILSVLAFLFSCSFITSLIFLLTTQSTLLIYGGIVILLMSLLLSCLSVFVLESDINKLHEINYTREDILALACINLLNATLYGFFRAVYVWIKYRDKFIEILIVHNLSVYQLKSDKNKNEIARIKKCISLLNSYLDRIKKGDISFQEDLTAVSKVYEWLDKQIPN